MARQLSFADLEFSKGAKKSRRGTFLDKMERVIPWNEICPIIAEYYVKEPKNPGRRPYPMIVPSYLQHGNIISVIHALFGAMHSY